MTALILHKYYSFGGRIYFKKILNKIIYIFNIIILIVDKYILIKIFIYLDNIVINLTNKNKKNLKDKLNNIINI